MESSKNISYKTSLIEEDTNISKFRKRNKILLIIFLSLFISLTIIIAALIIHLSHDIQSDYNGVNPAIQSYYNSACYTPLCRTTLNPIITTKSISDPNQIFTISLQTASKHLQDLTSLISSGDSVITFNNCSIFLDHALSRVNDTLAVNWVNPFVEMLSDEQRSEMMNWTMEVEENLEWCMDDLESKGMESTAVIEARGKVGEVQVYVSSSGAFLLSYAEVMNEFYSNGHGVISITIRRAMGLEYVFGISLCGSQLLFIFFLFLWLFRTR